MNRYDVESLLADIKNVLAANLDTKIDAIESQKVADGFPASGIGHIAAYFEQTFSAKVLAQSPVIFYGVEKIESHGNGPTTLKVYQCFIEVVLTDQTNDALVNTRVNRYTRAIEEVLEENYDKFPAYNGKIKIETLRPIAFKLDMDSSEETHVGGVSITLGIA